MPQRERFDWTAEQRQRIEELIDEYRVALHDSLDAEYPKRWETSRINLAGLQSDEIVDGRGARPVWALQLQVLRELAQHAGHADILRRQILASRSPRPSPTSRRS